MRTRWERLGPGGAGSELTGQRGVGRVPPEGVLLRVGLSEDVEAHDCKARVTAVRPDSLTPSQH